MKVDEREFLRAHSGCWISRRAPEFSVVNVHMAEIPAPRERIFPQLAAHDLLLPGKKWRALFGFRIWLGRLFGWDRGLKSHQPEPMEVGRHYVFFRIERVDEPREVGMSIGNRLTDAVMSWLLVEDGAGGTQVYNITCVNFHGRRGRMYWRAIRPSHDGIIEDALALLARRVRQS